MKKIIILFLGLLMASSSSFAMEPMGDGSGSIPNHWPKQENREESKVCVQFYPKTHDFCDGQNKECYAKVRQEFQDARAAGKPEPYPAKPKYYYLRCVGKQLLNVFTLSFSIKECRCEDKN